MKQIQKCPQYTAEYDLVSEKLLMVLEGADAWLLVLSGGTGKKYLKLEIFEALKEHLELHLQRTG